MTTLDCELTDAKPKMVHNHVLIKSRKFNDLDDIVLLNPILESSQKMNLKIF